MICLVDDRALAYGGEKMARLTGLEAPSRIWALKCFWKM
jgi:hypothetical protein